MSTTQRPTDSDRALLALEQARLLVQYLEQEDGPDYDFVRTQAMALLHLVEGLDGEGATV